MGNGQDLGLDKCVIAGVARPLETGRDIWMKYIKREIQTKQRNNMRRCLTRTDSRVGTANFEVMW